MCVCSGRKSESNPAASAARPSSTGSIVSSGAKVVRPIRTYGSLRGDVVVGVEHVAGVVAALDLAQAVVVGAVGGADRVLRLVVAQVVQPAAAVELGLQGGERLARPADVGVGRRGVRPHGREQEIPAD